jgi:uncharacterized protein (DUF58 family)
LIPKDLIRRIRRLEISTRKVVSDLLAGQYHSVFKGRGMAFSEVRQYQPGDEIRFIDWNVTARMNEPFVKVFTEERELTVMLVVDVSASQEFGSRALSKAEVCVEVAAQIAFSAIANNDRVGMILFSDQVEKVIPPKKGRKHVLRIVSDILSHQAIGRGTNVNVGLNYLSRVSKRRSVTFLISDFLVRDFETSLRIVSRRHDLVPVLIADPLEDAFPKLGLVALEDPESGERVLLDTLDPRVRGEFASVMQSRREELRKLFKKLELQHVELHAGEEYVAALVRFFRARARRMAA